VIYQRLAIELERAKLGFVREQEHVIYYEGMMYAPEELILL